MQNLQQVEDDIAVTKYLAQSNDVTVTKFLDAAQNDIAEARYLNMSQDPVLLKFLQQAEDDIAVTKYLYSMILEQVQAKLPSPSTSALPPPASSSRTNSPCPST